MNNYEAIVVGLGAMGSAALYQLAKRGTRVLGIDRFAPPHSMGSSHGETRITRQAIGEGEQYVPLALRSYEIWRELEAEAGLNTGALLNITGGLIMQSAGARESLHGHGNFLAETINCAEKFGIGHEVLTGDDIGRRFPQFALMGDESGYYEEQAGFLRPENCIATQLGLGRKLGADIHLNEKVLSYNASDGGVEVVTELGTYHAEKLIVSAGAWVGEFTGEEARKNFQVTKQSLHWFELKENATNYLVGEMPVFIWQFGRWKDDYIYGFPAIDGMPGGLKLATEKFNEIVAPETVSRETPEAESRKLYDEYISERLPGLGERCLRAAACLYTSTPDSGFVIDRHPLHEKILIASPCSGHGFKHSAAVGQILSELALDGRTDFDVSKFSLMRFNK
jgi:sarcosine oxidase